MSCYFLLAHGANNILLERRNANGSLDRVELGERELGRLRAEYGIQCNRELASTLRPEDADVFLKWHPKAEHLLPASTLFERLVWALFKNNAEVQQFVARVSDAAVVDSNARGINGQVLDYSDERAERALRVAWDRDEHGWRTDAPARSVRIRWELERVTTT